MNEDEKSLFNGYLADVQVEVRSLHHEGRCISGMVWNEAIRPWLLNMEPSINAPELPMRPPCYWTKIKDRKPAEGEDVVLLMMDGKVKAVGKWKKEMDDWGKEFMTFLDGNYPFAWISSCAFLHLADYIRKKMEFEKQFV